MGSFIAKDDILGVWCVRDERVRTVHVRSLFPAVT
jgi:hypothetical protein